MAWHAAGVLHLDIKPANVATTKAGDVVVLDAGVSRFATEGSVIVDGAVGTPGYIAPELRGDGKHVAIAACDVFSLGTTYRKALDRWVRTSCRRGCRVVRTWCSYGVAGWQTHDRFCCFDVAGVHSQGAILGCRRCARCATPCVSAASNEQRCARC